MLSVHVICQEVWTDPRKRTLCYAGLVVAASNSSIYFCLAITYLLLLWSHHRPSLWELNGRWQAGFLTV